MVTASTERTYGTYVSLAITNVAVSTGLLLLLANGLSIESYATFGVVSALGGLCLLLTNAGHKEALFKYSSQGEDEALRRTAQSLQSWLMPFFLLPLVLSPVGLWAALASLMFLLIYANIAATAVFRGREQYTKDASMWPLYRALWLAGCALAMLRGDTLSLAAIFSLGGLAAILTFVLLGGHKIVLELAVPSPRLSWPFEHPTLRQFFFIEVATVAYIKVDVLLLAISGIPSADLASYFFSVQLFEAALLLLMPVGYLFFNRISATGNTPDNRLTLLVFSVSASFAAVTVLLGWSILGPKLLDVFFSNYASSNLITATLLWALLPWGGALLLSYWLIAADKEYLVARVFFIGLGSHLLFNAVLIPLCGVHGAAYARVVTECLIACMLLSVAFKTGSLKRAA